MDTKRSDFVPALEHFWNGWASARKDILLIVCGSATSWIINKIIKDHGGLHNRVTHKIHLHQFTLKECEQYSRSPVLFDRASCLVLLFYYTFISPLDACIWGILESGSHF